jgi:hypothetical protein
VSPILTRPIREQLEHDRIIRQLQARYKRKHEVAINPGPEQNQSVLVGELAVFPDLVLFAPGGKRLEGTVEVETGESVNQLEALAEWGVFSKLKAPFHLYVPPQSIESARRICDEHQFPVAEIWTYHLSLDQVRFTQVYRSPNAPKPSSAPVRQAPSPAAAPRSAKPAAAAAKSARTVAPVKARATSPVASPKGKAVKAAKAVKPVKTKAVAPARAAKAAKASKAARPAKANAKAARARR